MKARGAHMQNIIMNFILSVYETKWMRQTMRRDRLETAKKANRVVNTTVIFHLNNGTELAEMSGHNGEWQ